ncbi:MAG: hypothetical protein NUV55_11810 [Sulfuricaulis sp.]|uniref:hypothetical protein n=1 Tax=Sulfuricaulis sp. TaxID=2003553 RepID=UPI0025F1F0C5|nr:hypothetical protein [Sulfuricaulis sp.]MCR4347871.1 hypothetical protein [Sulfuricaulis sp.]
MYWTGPAELSNVVNWQDHPNHRRSPREYEIDGTWLTEYWFRLARENRVIRAQIHTHPGQAFHSATDDQFPVVSQPGFISIVIPNFARGAVSLGEAWIGQLGADGHWHELAVESEIEITP